MPTPLWLAKNQNQKLGSQTTVFVLWCGSEVLVSKLDVWQYKLFIAIWASQKQHLWPLSPPNWQLRWYEGVEHSQPEHHSSVPVLLCFFGLSSHLRCFLVLSEESVSAKKKEKRKKEKVPKPLFYRAGSSSGSVFQYLTLNQFVQLVKIVLCKCRSLK